MANGLFRELAFSDGPRARAAQADTHLERVGVSMKDSGGLPCRVQGGSLGLQHCLPCTILTPTEVQSLYPLENKK